MIARLSLLNCLGLGGRAVVPVRGCEIGRDTSRALQSHSLSEKAFYRRRGVYRRDVVAFNRLRGLLRSPKNAPKQVVMSRASVT